jgi:hypothetical protein
MSDLTVLKDSIALAVSEIEALALGPYDVPVRRGAAHREAFALAAWDFALRLQQAVAEYEAAQSGSHELDEPTSTSTPSPW